VNLLIYTFRTFPYIDSLREKFGDVYIFRKLREDLEKYKKMVLEVKPDLITGFAESKNETQIESLAVNKFNSNKKIYKGKPDTLKLYIPPEFPFKVSNKSTSSFCNWTMYQISLFIREEQLPTQLIFLHVNKSDIDTVLKTLSDKLGY